MDDDHPEFRDCFDRNGKMKRLMREKALKKPSHGGEKEKPERMISRSNETLIIRENDHQEFRDCFDRKGKMKRLIREKALMKPSHGGEKEKPERMISRRNETLIIREKNGEEEEEDSRRPPPKKCRLHEIIAVTIEELDDRWEEKQRIKAGLDDHHHHHHHHQIGGVLDGEGEALREDFKARIREMKGTNLILVLEKKLFKTDIRKVENRLSIPANQIRKEFVREEEEEILRAGEGMKAVLIQPSLEVSTITLKKWKMKTTCYVYVLTTQWNSVVVRESLQKDDIVQVWSFRVGRELGFALVRV